MAPAVPIPSAGPGPVARFLSWWIGELKSLVPLPARRNIAPVADLTIRVGRSGFSLCEGGEEVPTGGREFESWDEVLAHLRASGPPKAMTLSVSPPLAFVRRMRVPRAALPRAAEILRLEMERVTPFRRADVLDGWRVAEDDGRLATLDLAHAILKRATLDPMLADLRDLGIGRVHLACALADGPDIPVETGAAHAGTASRHAALSRLNGFLAATLALLLLALPVLATARQHQALARLDERIAIVQAKAMEVREAIDAIGRAGEGLEALRARRAEYIPVARIWEELTRVLPDSAWLEEIRVDRAQVTISGFAQSAPELIGMVEASDVFRDAAFLSPVVRAPRENAERFDIEFRTGPPGADEPAE